MTTPTPTQPAGDELPLERLLAEWIARARQAHPSDAMLINRHIRELQAAMLEAQPPQAVPDAAPAAPVAPAAQGVDAETALNAKRYRRLALLGCAPMGHPCLDRGTVLRWQTLDAFVDSDLLRHPYRGDVGESPIQRAEAGNADYPECGGNPASCPENEGHGCCKSNPSAALAEAIATIENDSFAASFQSMSQYRKAVIKLLREAGNAGGGESPELAGVRQAIEEGDGFWRSCSGCHELNEGHDTGPFSKVFRCALGNGCSECGGLGAVWDDTDYEDMANSMRDAQPEQSPSASAEVAGLTYRCDRCGATCEEHVGTHWCDNQVFTPEEPSNDQP